MKVLHWIAKILVIVGALNWGLIGLFDYNFVAMILGGEMTALTRTVYALVGFSGLYCLLYHCRKRCCCCGGSCGSGGCGCGTCKGGRGQR
jgi:uncharacterized membrane protein YuzA (DUF378 family)